MRKLIGTVVILGILGTGFFVVRKVRNLESASPPVYGITFSRSYAEFLGLHWKETYLALLDDLNVKKVRLPIYWNDVEKKQSTFTFADYDWMIEEAEKRQVELILAVGQKLPRWPECHIPDWAGALDKESRQEAVRNYLIATVNRYKSSFVLAAWQVENEPFVRFGDCPKLNVDFLDAEISLVHGLDDHPVIITDSGQLSFWVRAASRGDWFGTTMYRVIWNRWTGYITYPWPPAFYKVKRVLVELFARPERMIVIELQAEPWMPNQPGADYSFDEASRSMNPEKFRGIVDYASNTSFDTFYLWGAEWWWWLKTEHDSPEMWNIAKQLFK